MGLPLLLLHGGSDRVNAATGTGDFYARVMYPDKTIRIYPGSSHELHNDLDRDQVLRDIEQWLVKRL